MKPADQIHLFFLEEQGILLHEPLQKLYHLNTIATFIWCLLEEREKDAELRNRLAETFNLTIDRANLYVSQTEELFQSLNVIQGFEIEDNGVADEVSDPAEAESYSDDIFVRKSRYSLLNSKIKMRFTNMIQHTWVDPVLNHLSDNVLSKATTTIDIIEDANGKLILYRDHTPVLVCENYNELAPMAKSLVWQTAINAHNFFLDIHAGVVGNGKCCFLMPAASGCGKSTLTAALVHSGFEYFSDEVALLHEGNLWVEAVPLANCIKDTGLEITSQFYPQLASLKLHYRGDGKRVRYVSPPADVTPSPGTRRPVGAIVFPQYLPNKETSLKPISKIEAMVLLEQECLIIGTYLDRSKVADFLKWIDRTPCYRLITTDLNKAVELFKTLSTSLEVELQVENS